MLSYQVIVRTAHKGTALRTSSRATSHKARAVWSPTTKRLAIRLDEPSIRDKAPSRQHLSTTCAKSCSTPGYALHSNLSRSDVAAQIAPRLSCDRPQIAHISKIPSFRKYLCNLTSTPRLQLPLLRPVTPAAVFCHPIRPGAFRARRCCVRPDLGLRRRACDGHHP